MTTPATASDVALEYPLASKTAEEARQEQLILRGEETLIASCMAASGFRYLPEVNLPESALLRDANQPGRQYGFVTPAEAAQRGYGIPDRLAGPVARPLSPNEKLSAALGPVRQQAWNLALIGDPATRVDVDIDGDSVISYNADGCISKARERVHGDGQKYTYTYKKSIALASSVLRRVVADPAFKHAEAKWRSCMGGHGYPYASHRAALDALSQERGVQQDKTAEFRKHEFAVASTDAQCTIDAGQWSVASTLQRTYEDAVRTENATFFASVTRQRAAAAINAKGIVARD